MSTNVNHAERSHALLSASGSHRWINCPASPLLEENFPEQEPSPYAEQGTLAHELAEIMLKVDLKIITLTEYKNQLTELKKNKHWYDTIMEDVKPYVDYVKQQFKEAKRKDPFAKILIEQKFDLTKYVYGGFGTSDCAIVHSGTIEIIDLKFGAGQLVSAKDNSQLMYYALGILTQLFDHDGLQIKMTIVQPRMDNIQTESMPSFFLRKWGEEVLKVKALEAHSGEGEQKAGDWCQYCRAKPKCRALHDKAIEITKKDFADLEDPRLISDDELINAFKEADFIKKWLEAVKSTVLKDLLDGKKYKGYKVVEGRSNRVFKDETKVLEALEENLYEQKDFCNIKLKGLGDLEKLLGRKGFDSILGDLIHKPAGAPTVVPESDKRPIFGIGQIEKDFAEPIEEDYSDLI